MNTALERWNELLAARARQMDTAYARLGRTSADFWDRRARGFHRSTKDTATRDPFFLSISRQVTGRTTVLDIGAGTGRFTLALAPLVLHVTAVEPSEAMLTFLQKDASEQGLTNISLVQSSWENSPADLAADVTICSHVLYPIQDIVPFLEKMLTATRKACYIYMRALSLDALTAHLWKHFHGDERCFPPGYIHALDILYEMGIYAEVEIVTVRTSLRYPSLDVVVEEQLEQLILPDNDQVRTELRGLLAGWLVEEDGMLVPPVREMVCAIIHIARA